MAIQNVFFSHDSKLSGARKNTHRTLVWSTECQGADEASTFQEGGRHISGQGLVRSSNGSRSLFSN